MDGPAAMLEQCSGVKETLEKKKIAIIGGGSVMDCAKAVSLLATKLGLH